MQIEQIVAPVPPAKHWTLHLEDGSHLCAYQNDMIDLALHTGMDLDDEALEILRSHAALSALRERTLSILSHRNCSKGELCRKLLDKGATQSQADALVAWAERIGLLCEEDYAASIVRHYAAKGWGLYRIRDELYRRQIPKHMWDKALAQLPEPSEDIDRYLEKHLTSHDRKAVKKAADALARRGFSWSDISDGLRRHTQLDAYDE